ncbi:hypothetical protein CFC21_057938 [Triticum aestivum]|uniref:DUF7378 domain-containing protein n=3 Tax=Triticum TaxID=4564 RepID=A0A9R0SDH9_TRITD|nr:uncharacterized protein LOC123086516 [Triticum aestivum]KAF7049393.1 hypothetical protein CFC21_057938 [Triticum aestivum]VAH92971.1 unnamed protein product [Triticum turgidum subsp. durum]
MTPSASVGKEVNLKEVNFNLKEDKNIPCAIQFVTTMLGTSSTLTIGDRNKKFRVSRSSTWITVVFTQSMFIATTAGWIYDMYNKPIWNAGFPWWLPVAVLLGAYLAVVDLARGYLTLFVPQAPLAAWNALDEVGFKVIGFSVILISVPVFLFDQAWLHITFACLLSVLIATILAFCVCLVRTYRQ